MSKVAEVGETCQMVEDETSVLLTQPCHRDESEPYPLPHLRCAEAVCGQHEVRVDLRREELHVIYFES